MSDNSQAFSPDYAVPPGETLADVIDDRDLSQTDLAKRLGVSLKHVNQVVNGSATISAEFALDLENVLGIPAAFWVARESNYRAILARQERKESWAGSVDWARRFPLKDLRTWGLIPEVSAGPELVESVTRYFGIASPQQLEATEAAFRKSAKFDSDPDALLAWLRWGEIQASEIDCDDYDEAHFQTALRDIRALTSESPETWMEPLRKLCASAGVAVALTPEFSKVRANGAARWMSPSKAIIQLSDRYKREDIFWFTFFHEAAHLILHRKKQMFIEPKFRKDRASIDPELEVLEVQADRFAANALIPKEFESELSSIDPGDSDAVKSFATRIGISPAIVVGRRQHDTGDYRRGRELVRQIKTNITA